MKNKSTIIMIICAIGLIPTSLYIYRTFHKFDLLMIGLWALFIYVGTIASFSRDENENEKSINQKPL
jgi:hypothetical protein